MNKFMNLIFMQKHRRAVLWIIAIIVIGTAFASWQYNKSKESEEIQGTTPIATQNPAPINSGGSKSGIANDVTVSLTYSQAVAIFAKERIQFNEECKIIPTPIWVKSGTTIMFDNRFRDARTFKLDGVTYSLPGYGYKLLQLKSSKLPKVVKVQCGDTNNNGEIHLQ